MCDSLSLDALSQVDHKIYRCQAQTGAAVVIVRPPCTATSSLHDSECTCSLRADTHRSSAAGHHAGLTRANVCPPVLDTAPYSHIADAKCGVQASFVLLESSDFRPLLQEDYTWARDSIPFFATSDLDLTTAYYFRWRVYRYVWSSTCRRSTPAVTCPQGSRHNGIIMHQSGLRAF